MEKLAKKREYEVRAESQGEKSPFGDFSHLVTNLDFPQE